MFKTTLYKVFLSLVEQHWDEIRDDQGNSDLTFREMRKRIKKKSVDKDVADLAKSYWKRNRFKLRETFVRYFAPFSKKRSVYMLMTSVNVGLCIADYVESSPKYEVDEFWLKWHLPLSIMKKREARCSQLNLNLKT